ncbi:hypothetical protein RN001_010662 [Aquatica leii]|uniref:Lipase n=1 Tax=Aquatica leii TaxID=1421715 RepID=A0AAN7P9Z3_9COLE|nr:hypothetical protein RN001_010662 [Aquatica leii]
MYKIFFILFITSEVIFCFPKFVQKRTNDANLNSGPEELAQRFGFYCESHEVITDDGYVLTVHRIKSAKIKPKQNAVVVLVPGFLAASETWLFRGPDKDLPYVFANNGYDVWICNPRGNYFSRKHTTLNPDVDVSFWNFSIHEHGVYDLPAVVDYTLNVTKEDSVYFFGHSIGAAAFFIMCAEKPQYNVKIKLANALAPAAIVSQPLTSFTQFLLSLIPPLMKFLKFNGIHEMFPRGGFYPLLGQVLCQDGAITQALCLSLIFAVVGTSSDQFNRTMLPEALGYYPTGTSIDVFNHLYDIFVTKRFGPLYASTEYTLELVTAPVALHYGDGDGLISKEDNEILSKRLRNAVGIFKVPYRNFNHIDFMWSIDSKILLYDHLISLMKLYK